MKLTSIVGALGVLTLLFSHTAIAQCASSDPSSNGITPTFVGGNDNATDCTTNGTSWYKFDPVPAQGSHFDGYGTISLNTGTGACGAIGSWSNSSNIVIDYVNAKGGSFYNQYSYQGTGFNADGNLHPPVNASGNYAGWSHISFCYHYKLDVGITASAEYTRTYSWQVLPICQADATISAGQGYSLTMGYSASSTYEDSNWKATGTVTISNNTPHATTITGISIPGGSISCADNFPIALAAGAVYSCTYEISLAGPVNGVAQVSVTSSNSLVEGDDASASYTFGNPTLELDECITVTSENGPQVICQPGGSLSWTKTVSYAMCNTYAETNSLSIAGSDGATTYANATCTTQMTVTGCSNTNGCTLTIGYWKTHSEVGPAPYDDNWLNVGPNQSASLFFGSGQSWHTIFWTAPAGNAYYNLAHQYMGSKLNVLNGASTTTDVDAAIQWAETYFGGLIGIPSKNQISKSTKSDLIYYAGILASYNEGITGPGHCDDNSTPSSRGEDWMNLPDESSIVAKSYPNPFRYSTQIDVTLPKSTQLSLRVYNLSGQLISTIVEGTFAAGKNSFIWEPTSNLPMGMYIYRIETADEVLSNTIVLIR